MIDEFQRQDMPRIMAAVAAFFAGCKDGQIYTIEIKERRKKRSLDANAYFWTLAHQVAAASGVDVRTVYIEYIRNIGDNHEIVCVQDNAVEDFCRIWESRGIGWPAVKMPSKIAGCTNVICYAGSSTFDTAQMARLIDMVIQDCKEYGIEYLTPRELQELLNAWEGMQDEG